MAEEKQVSKKFTEWEHDKNLLIADATKAELDSELTEDEFNERWTKDLEQGLGVHWDNRKRFLEANGYEVTRENMTADLPNTLPVDQVLENHAADAAAEKAA